MRFPRKLKKKLKKIPHIGFCYGAAIGDKGKMENGKRRYKRYYCPFHSNSSLHCAVVNNRKDDDWMEACLSDSTAISWMESVYIHAFSKRLVHQNGRFLLSKEPGRKGKQTK